MAETRHPEYFPNPLDLLDEVTAARMKLGTVGSRACQEYFETPGAPIPEESAEYKCADLELRLALNRFESSVHMVAAEVYTSQ